MSSSTIVRAIATARMPHCTAMRKAMTCATAVTAMMTTRHEGFPSDFSTVGLRNVTAMTRPATPRIRMTSTLSSQPGPNMSSVTSSAMTMRPRNAGKVTSALSRIAR